MRCHPTLYRRFWRRAWLVITVFSRNVLDCSSANGIVSGDKAFKKPHALVEPVCSVLALLLFLLMDKPLFLVCKLSDFLINARDFFGFGFCLVWNGFLQTSSFLFYSLLHQYRCCLQLRLCTSMHGYWQQNSIY